MKNIIGIISVFLLIASCAKEIPDPTEGLTDITHKAWMDKNAPNAKHLEEGIYIEFIDKVMPRPEMVPKVDSTWMEINYTGYRFDGTVFITRSENVSKLVGKYTTRTHWCDDYINYNPSKSPLGAGIYRGLIEMRDGDSARIYLPQKYSTPATLVAVHKGYQGETDAYYNSPTYYDVRVKNLANKPLEFEEKRFHEFAEIVWNKASKDTIVKGVYQRRIKADDPESDFIVKKHKTVTIDVTEFFTDGFIISTTNDSIAKDYKIYDKTAYYTKIDVLLEGEGARERQMFAKALLNMQYGEESELLCMSHWTEEGITGLYDNTPQINPYTSRIFRIKALPKKEEEEKK